MAQEKHRLCLQSGWGPDTATLETVGLELWYPLPFMKQIRGKQDPEVAESPSGPRGEADGG